MTNFVVKRADRGTGQVFAKGKRAISIDDRSGFKKLYKNMVFEPGTNYWVHWDESDKDFSLVSHPQNYVNKEKLVDKVGLKYAHPDVLLSVATVSADTLSSSTLGMGTILVNYPDTEV